jgi:hypothetical protein
MVYDYIITLKRPNYNAVDQVSQLLYIFAILAFGYLFYLYGKAGVAWLVVIIAVLVTWVFTVRKKELKGIAYFRLGLLFAAIGWVIGPQQNIWMGLLFAIAAIIEKQVKFPSEIGFSKEEIAYNTFPNKKKIQWSELNNVILKDGLLTLDHKNNTLVQKEIDEAVSPLLENEFNNFCRGQLEVVD